MYEQSVNHRTAVTHTCLKVYAYLEAIRLQLAMVERVLTNSHSYVACVALLTYVHTHIKMRYLVYVCMQLVHTDKIILLRLNNKNYELLITTCAIDKFLYTSVLYTDSVYINVLLTVY